jgi:hypothetical protein
VRVRVLWRGHRIGRRVRSVTAGVAQTVVVRLSRRARRAAPLRATVRVRLPGERHDRIRHVRLSR